MTNRSRKVTLDCGQGPVLAVAGRFVHTSISTTVGALLDGAPIAARPCDDTPIALPLGSQELLISPGPAFVVDGARLSGPPADDAPGATPTPVDTGVWGPARREVSVPAAAADRVLVVPESINPGWVAHTADGRSLSPVTVNGWQQGWVLPAGTAGTITVTFPSNAMYRAGLAGGLGLLPLLALLALWRRRRGPDTGPPSRPWAPGPVAAAVAMLGVGGLIAGLPGAAVFAAVLGVRYGLRHRRRRSVEFTVGLSAVGLITATAVLARYPWRSVDGYVGHSPGVQLLALVSVAAVAAAVVPLVPAARRGDEGDR